MITVLGGKIHPSTDLVGGEAAAKLRIISNPIPAWSEKNYHLKLSDWDVGKRRNMSFPGDSF